MALNLNTLPYFDDFDSTKNYNRILFKPGVAVQARELTQLQTALQNQISNLGSFTLKDGAVISGCQESVTPVPYIKINDEYYPNGTAATTALTNASLKSFIGYEVEGQTSGIRAKIIGVHEGSVSERPDLKAFYLAYTKFNGQGEGDQHFVGAERLKIISSGNALNTEFTTSNLAATPLTLSDNYYGTTTKLQLSPGIIYALGQFITTPTISTYVHPFSNSVVRKIGFELTESVKTYADDTTLLDPAQGSYNYNAPGADRYNLTVQLKSYAPTVQLPELFFEYALFEYGHFVRHKIREDKLSELGKIINARSYETFGNFVSYGMNLRLREHLDDGNNGGVFTAANNGDEDKLVVHVNPGYCEVAGSPKMLEKPKFITIDKPTATITDQDQTLTTTYGNYVLIKEVCGVWDIDGSSTVDLYDTAQTAVSGAGFSSTSASGNVIGTAKVRHFVHESGTPGAAACTYRLYLYDINMTSGGFVDVRSIYYNDATADAFADISLSNTDDGASQWAVSTYYAPNQLVYNGDYLYTVTVAGTSASSGSGPTHTSGTATDGTITWQYAGTANYGAVLREKEFNKLLFPLPYSYMKTIAPSGTYDYDFQYTKEFVATVSSGNGEIALSLSGNETFPYSVGALSNTTILANIQVVANDSFSTTTPSDTLSLGEVIDLTASGRSVTVNSTTSMTIDLGATASASSGLDVKVYANIQVQDTTPIQKTLNTNQYVSLLVDGTDSYATSETEFCLGVADVLRVTSIRVHSSAFSTGSEGTDVTNQFNFVNGQKDNYYGLAKIFKKSSSTVDFSTTPYVLVKFDYFSRNTTGPTFSCVDSYAAAISAGNMTIQEIPLYLDNLGRTHDLRNYIDFRPYAENTATPTGTVGSATQNPEDTITINKPTNGITYPVPVQEFTTDYEYYLAQGFRVVVTADGEINAISNPPSIRPTIPSASNVQDMTLGTFILRPYPSLSHAAAKYYNRLDLANKITPTSNPKYTMRQIGGLEERIANLEYYTSLSILEQQAKDEKFLDDSGVDRFKNGLLVDAFKGFATAAVMKPDYKCAIHKSDGILRAHYADEFISLKPNFVGATDEAAQTNKTYHVPFAELVYTENLVASKWEAIVTELLYVEDEQTRPCPPGYYYDTDLEACALIPRDEETVPDDEDKGDPAPEVAYTITRSTPAVNEGDSITMTIDADYVDQGVTVPWTLSASGYTLVSGDFTSGSVSGTATIDLGGQATVSWTFARHTGITADTTLTFALGSTDSDNNSTGSKSKTFTLYNTNTLPTVCENGYELAEDGLSCVPIVCPLGEYYSVAEKGCVKYPPDPTPTCGVGNTKYGEFTVLSPSNDPSSFDTRYDKPDIEQPGDPSSINFEYAEDGWHLDYDRIVNDGSSYIERGGVVDSGEIAVGEPRETPPELIPGVEGNVTPLGHTYYIDQDYQAYTDYAQNEIQPKKREWSYSYQGTLPSSRIKTGEKEISRSSVTGYIRPQQIRWAVAGLCANTSHVLTVGGKSKGIFNTNSQGRMSGTFNIEEGEFNTGALDISLDCNALVNNGLAQSSTASTVFTAGDDVIIHKAYVYDVTTAPIPRKKTGTSPATAVSTPLDPVRVTGDTRTSRSPKQYYYYDYTRDTYVDSEVPPTVQHMPNNIIAAVEDVSTADALINTYIRYTTNTATGAAWGEDLTEGFATYELSHLDDYTANAYATSANNYVANEPTVTVESVKADVEIDYDLTNYEAIWEDVWLGVKAEMGRDYGLCMGWDPMAQSFFIENQPYGVYISSVDMFFHSVSSEADNNGITLELRNMVNGYPGDQVLGKSRMERRNCNVSIDNGDGTYSPQGTVFRFPNPVYLENNTEYCIVPIPDSDDPNYTVWIAELGQKIHGSDNVVSKQAHSGILFTSANNRTWTPRQKEDMMFRIKRATFSTNTNYKVKLCNSDHDWTNFDSFSDSSTKFDIGDKIHNFTFVIGNSGGSGYGSPPTVEITDTTGKGTGATATATVTGGVVTGITLTNPGSGYTGNSIITVALTGVTPTSAATVTATLNLGAVLYHAGIYDETSTIKVLKGYFVESNSSTVDGTETTIRTNLVGNGTKTANVNNIFDRVISSYALKMPFANYGNRGSVLPTMALTNTGASSANTTHSSVTIGDFTELDTEKTIYSYSNEQVNYAGAKTCTFEVTLRTDSEAVGPMMNSEHLLLNAYKNEINNDSSGEETRIGGTATTRYISRKVRLEDGQDAEDIVALLDNNIPTTNASVEVYYKIQNADDERASFDADLIWRKMEVTKPPSTINRSRWQEYKYGIPEKGSNSFGLNDQGVVEYDVTGISNISVSSGGTGYTSAPTVNITHSGDGFGARAYAEISAGAVSNIVVTNPGRGYDGGTITVTLTGGGYSSVATVGTVTRQTSTYQGFKYYAIKIVHLNNSTVKIPTSKKLRAYALQV